MKKLLLIALIVSLAVLLASIPRGETESKIVPAAGESVHPNQFFMPEYFSPRPEGEQESSDNRIDGAVVPHHLLAHQLISQVFSRFRQQEPSLLVLVGPNHHNRGERIITGTWDWQTPFGTVEVDREVVGKLLDAAPVKQDDMVLDSEHSIGNLMPFIKFYLPETKVVPLILHHDVSRQEAKLLAEQLNEVTDEGAVIIASVDFSHYLTREEAQQKDRETMAALKADNLGRIFSMGNDYLDSPASLGVLFTAMDARGLNEFKVLANTNSGMILKNDLIETTSYFSLVFECGYK
ncbi:AmmeMemoRadiSam system protein B [Metallumcola ferriviriculae]|uniref:AmmeMemoRadiSam system protein B n=1 Tax=Metallumcola ferriviriculae TaxID=3039180 RepID=A0AAU0UPA2_9FIRM|nr:AmmeMemoRadiSam system protein B [Desulfitibacteraceae bacterium MK1]